MIAPFFPDRDVAQSVAVIENPQRYIRYSSYKSYVAKIAGTLRSHADVYYDMRET